MLPGKREGVGKEYEMKEVKERSKAGKAEEKHAPRKRRLDG